MRMFLFSIPFRKDFDVSDVKRSRRKVFHGDKTPRGFSIQSSQLNKKLIFVMLLAAYFFQKSILSWLQLAKHPKSAVKLHGVLPSVHQISLFFHSANVWAIKSSNNTEVIKTLSAPHSTDGKNLTGLTSGDTL